MARQLCRLAPRSSECGRCCFARASPPAVEPALLAVLTSPPIPVRINGGTPTPPQVSAIHKANIMKKADGLFIQCCREVRAHVTLGPGPLASAHSRARLQAYGRVGDVLPAREQRLLLEPCGPFHTRTKRP